MSAIDYKVSILNLKAKEGSISFSALKEITDAFSKGSDLQKSPGLQEHSRSTGELVIEKKFNHNALKKLWGKWPGDESIEDILAAL